MARPRKHVDVAEVVRLRRLGLSWSKIARGMRLGQGTVFRAFHEAVRKTMPFQNPSALIPTEGGHFAVSGTAQVLAADVIGRVSREASSNSAGSEKSK